MTGRSAMLRGIARGFARAAALVWLGAAPAVVWLGAAPAVVWLAATPAWAQTGSATPKSGRGGALGELGSNKSPINIDSDRLEVFDKEGRAVFTGNVVAVQADSTMRCTSLNVFYEQAKPAAGTPSKGGALSAASGGMGENSAIKKIECRGPVTVVSKTQTATGDNAEFDRVANRVYMLGNVSLSDGPNITRGERLVYDLNTGRANVETKPGGRVRAMFVPGGGDDKTKKPQR